MFVWTSGFQNLLAHTHFDMFVDEWTSANESPAIAGRSFSRRPAARLPISIPWQKARYHFSKLKTLTVSVNVTNINGNVIETSMCSCPSNGLRQAVAVTGEGPAVRRNELLQPGRLGDRHERECQTYRSHTTEHIDHTQPNTPITHNRTHRSALPTPIHRSNTSIRIDHFNKKSKFICVFSPAGVRVVPL